MWLENLKEDHHSKIEGAQKLAKYPLVQLDSLFMKDVTHAQPVTCVTAVEIATTPVFCFVAPGKGDNAFVVRSLIEWLRTNGFTS